jgi:hypothetical protein
MIAARDIRIDAGLLRHPKILALRVALGPLADRGVLGLIALWTFAAEVRPTTGGLEGYSDAVLEARAEWAGAPGALIAALRSAGLLDGEPGQLAIHDWRDHQPFLVAATERQRAARLGGEARRASSGRRSVSGSHAWGAWPRPASRRKADLLALCLLAACRLLTPTNPPTIYSSSKQSPNHPVRRSSLLRQSRRSNTRSIDSRLLIHDSKQSQRAGWPP